MFIVHITPIHIQKFATAIFLFDLKLLKGSKVLESGSIYKKVYKLHHRLWKPYQSGTDSNVNCEWVILAILSCYSVKVWHFANVILNFVCWIFTAKY